MKGRYRFPEFCQVAQEVGDTQNTHTMVLSGTWTPRRPRRSDTEGLEGSVRMRSEQGGKHGHRWRIGHFGSTGDHLRGIVDCHGYNSAIGWTRGAGDRPCNSARRIGESSGEERGNEDEVHQTRNHLQAIEVVE